MYRLGFPTVGFISGFLHGLETGSNSAIKSIYNWRVPTGLGREN